MTRLSFFRYGLLSGGIRTVTLVDTVVNLVFSSFSFVLFFVIMSKFGIVTGDKIDPLVNGSDGILFHPLLLL